MAFWLNLKMRVLFHEYGLDQLEESLTVRHPLEGWPVWMPVIGIRTWFKFQREGSNVDGIARAYRRFMEKFGKELAWQQGLTSNRRTKFKAGGKFPTFPSSEASQWQVDLSGPGETKLQAFQCSFRSAAVRAFDGWITGHVYIAIPIAAFLREPALVEDLIVDLARVNGMQAGFAGLCGAGTPDFASSWRAPEIHVLQNYMGIDPSEDARLNMGQMETDGYSHAGQWITLLGAAAVDRLGGIDQARSAATAAGLSVAVNGCLLQVKASEMPETGFRYTPPGYRAMDRFLAVNRGSDYFIGHGFISPGQEALNESGRASNLWARRLEPSSEWSKVSRRLAGIDVGMHSWGEPEVVGLP